ARPVGGQQLGEAADRALADHDLRERVHPGELRQLGATVRVACQIDLLVVDPAAIEQGLGALTEWTVIGGVEGDWVHRFTKYSGSIRGDIGWGYPSGPMRSSCARSATARPTGSCTCTRRGTGGWARSRRACG